MTGQEWLDYFMADQQKKRKNDWMDMAGTGLGAGIGMLVGGPAGAVAGSQIGGAAGGLGEAASNKELTPGGVVGGVAQGVGGYGGLTKAIDQKKLMELLAQMGGQPMGFAGGGVVPGFEGAGMDPLLQLLRAAQPQADPYAGMTAEQVVGEPPAQPQYAQARHPGWEMAASILGDVMGKLPAPRQTNSSNKTIGAYMPAAGAAVGGVPAYLQGQREAANKPLREEYLNKRKEYDRGLTDVRVAMLKRKMGLDKADGAGSELSPEQFEALGVPEQYRTKAGYDAWLKLTSRNDANLNRMQVRAATNKDIAQFPEMRDAYKKIKASAGGGTGVADMALVFSFMRLLDPTSVVREGEYERAIKTEGIPGWLWSRVQAVQSGKFLTPEQRADMARMAEVYYTQKRDTYRRARQWIDRTAKYYGLDPTLAIPDLEAPNTYIEVSQAQPDGAPGGGLDEYGVPVPKLRGAMR